MELDGGPQVITKTEEERHEWGLTAFVLAACLVVGGCSLGTEQQAEPNGETDPETATTEVPGPGSEDHHPAPISLDAVGHVAAFGTPNRQQHLDWMGVDNYHLDVIVCTQRPDEWVSLDLPELRQLERFFARETTSVELQVGTSAKVVTADGMNWSATMADLYEDAAAGRESGCDAAARKAAEPMEKYRRDLHPDYSQPILLLVDVPTGGVSGYATYGGVARVSLHLAVEGEWSEYGGVNKVPLMPAPDGEGSLAFVAAHELGHSLFHLPHTDEADGASCQNGDRWILMHSGTGCNPARDVLDFEITCAERRLLEWRCRHEPLPDRLFDDFYDRLKIGDKTGRQWIWENTARSWEEAITLRLRTEEEIAQWAAMPKYPGREDEPPPTTWGRTLWDLRLAMSDFAFMARSEAERVEGYLDVIADHLNDPRNTSNLEALSEEAALWRRIEEAWGAMADEVWDAAMSGAPDDAIDWDAAPSADFPIPPTADEFARWMGL